MGCDCNKKRRLNTIFVRKTQTNIEYSSVKCYLKLIWDSIPSQIARENNKFIFSHVKQGARLKDLEDALEWLVNAGIAGKLCMVPTPDIPLSGKADYTYFTEYLYKEMGWR